MKPIKYAETYDDLKRQAGALHTLVCNHEKTISYLVKKDYTTNERHIKELEEQLECERAMNAILTEELSKYE